MSLRHSRATDKVVDLAQQRVAWESAQIRKEIHLLDSEEVFEVVVAKRLIPEGAEVHARHFRILNHTTQRPHESTVARSEATGA